MATEKQIDLALREDDRFRRRILMSPEERRPRFRDNGGVETFINEMTEEQIEESKKFLTPNSWNDTPRTK